MKIVSKIWNFKSILLEIFDFNFCRSRLSAVQTMLTSPRTMYFPRLILISNQFISDKIILRIKK